MTKKEDRCVVCDNIFVKTQDKKIYCSQKCYYVAKKNKMRSNAKKQRYISKQILVEHLGGKCSLCGYSKNYAALEFHHLDDDEKEYGVSRLLHKVGIDSIKKIEKEIEKCVLLCSNCHRELHNPEHFVKVFCEEAGSSPLKKSP